MGSLNPKVYLSVLAAPLMVGVMSSAAIALPLGGYSVGAGIRGGLNDDTSLAIGGKIPITRFEIQDVGLGLSARPDVILGNETEFRAAVTIDASASRVNPYGGVGLAYNASGNGDTNPMLSAGVEFDLQRNYGLRLGGNYIIKDGDTDAELLIMGTFNF